MYEWRDTGDFLPHGICLSWDPELMTAFVLSNGLIAIAYMIITLVLAVAARQPKPAMPRWLYWSFAAFVFCCGVSHILDDVTLWLPVYRLQAVVLGLTAIVSTFAAVLPLSLWATREFGRGR
jgi:uncharacterized membrane protein